MGKSRITQFLAAVPITASIVVNTTIYQDKNNIQFEPAKTNTTNYYEVDKKFKAQPSPELALKIANNGAEKSIQNESSENTLTIADQSVEQPKTKIVLAVSDKTAKDKVEVKDGADVNNDGTKTSKDPTDSKTVNDNQLAVMEKMVSGYPMEKMLPYLAKRRPETAAFLVAIAKKESNWGKVSPRSKDGDCSNYWGFKDHRFKFAAGHSCFPSAEVAVETVGNRIDKLVAKGMDTPSRISIWKCGSACAKDGNVGKWISDVNLYYKPILAAGNKEIADAK